MPLGQIAEINQVLPDDVNASIQKIVKDPN